MAQIFRFLCALLVLICYATTASVPVNGTETTTKTPLPTAINGSTSTNNTTTPSTTNTTTNEITPSGGTIVTTNGTTDKPGNTTGGPSPQPTTPSESNTTVNTTTPSGSNTTTNVTTDKPGNTTGGPSPQPTTPPNPCLSNPCGPGATCQQRGTTYECLCLPGEYYNGRFCETAKVFPNEVSFRTNSSEGLNDTNSDEFKKKSDEVIKEIDIALRSSPGYLNSTVVRFLTNPISILRSRNDISVTALVNVIFEENSTITDTTIKDSIVKHGVNCNCALQNASVQIKTVCQQNPCDETTTDCESFPGSFNCTCKTGYFKVSYSDRVCIACPSGQERAGNECVNCPFGLSGLNCGDNSKLVLTIVGSVLGGLLLITTITALVFVARSKKHPKASTGDIGKPYTSHFSASSQLVNSGAGINQPFGKSAQAVGGMPRIPRATANSNWNNNLEMSPSNSQQNLIPNGGNSKYSGDYNNAGSHSQSRPQNNPYARNRPQSNPYASDQGRDNPYYKYDSR